MKKFARRYFKDNSLSERFKTNKTNSIKRPNFAVPHSKD